MEVLNLSLDSKILNTESRAFERIRWYNSIKGVERYVVIVADSLQDEVVTDSGIKVIGSGGNNKVTKFIRTFILTFKLLRKEDFDLITTQNPFELGLIGYIASLKNDIGLNLQVHNEFFNREYWRKESLLNFLRYYLGKFIIKRADSIRVVNQKIKDFISQELQIKKEKIINVPVFTETGQFNFGQSNSTGEKGKFKDNFIFLSVGRFVKQKNLPLLINSFYELNQEYPDTTLVLVGGGTQKKRIKKQIKKKDLESSVIIEGWTDNISKYYNLADTYVLTSNYEGWGRVIIEAAHSGLPIIMTDVGCAREVIEDKKEGLIVPIGKQESIISAMEQMLTNDGLRKSIQSNLENINTKLLDKEETLNLYLKSWEKAST